MKIEVERKGKTIKVNAKVAEVLMRKGIVREAYQTRDMVAAPVESVRVVTAVSSPSIEGSADDMDSMDKEQLHALAKQRGLSLHHLLGAEKVRAALREAAAQ